MTALQCHIMTTYVMHHLIYYYFHLVGEVVMVCFKHSVSVDLSDELFNFL